LVAKKRKIMFVDGQASYRDSAEKEFKKYGFDYIICNSGQESLDKIENSDPDVVIVDAMLPDILGEDVYLQFLSNPKYRSKRKIPFIILTQNGNSDRSKLYSMGFSACINKPFGGKDLIEFIEDALVSHQVKMEEIYCWETIREAKDFLERVVESSLDSIITTDGRGIISYCNRASEEMLGYHFEELVGKRISQFLLNGPTELLKISAHLRKRNKLLNYKTTLLRKNGEPALLNLSISTMRNGSGNVMGALAISKEVSSSDFLEYESFDSERLATVVETAVAVNHAINNPLVPILGNAQFLLQDERIADEDLRRRLRVIVKNALRIRDITQKLASISHPVSKEYLKGTRMLDIEAST